MKLTVEMSLRTHLNLDSLPLATTESGRKFALKALHPSDSTIKSAQVPGRNSNTVAVSIDQVVDVPVGSQGWVDVEVIPHPLAPVVLANESDLYVFFNPPWGEGVKSSDYASSMTTAGDNFKDLVEKYCVTSQSVTCELIAPSTASQGTVVACQYSNPAQIVTTSPSLWGYTTTWGTTRAAVVEVDPAPTIMMAGTRAYNAKAIEGCYMPLRLEDFEYHSFNHDFVSFFNAIADGKELPQFFESDVRDHLYARPYGLKTGTDPTRTHTVIPTQDNWGKVSFRGCSPDANIRVRVRQTLELVVDPKSSYAPLAEAPCAPDDLALRMYKEISARMKDAYPASYNDWETLKRTVIAIGQKVLPLVSPALSIATKALPFGGAINSLGQAALEGLSKKIGAHAIAKDVAQSIGTSVGSAMALVPVRGLKPTPPKPRRARRKAKKQQTVIVPASGAPMKVVTIPKPK